MKKIAVIEDDVDLFDLLKYNLEREGYQFTGLQTGKGAVEFCRRERPDLVILDVTLPHCDGLDICKEMRGHPDLAAVPVIFLTARAAEADRILGLELGGNDYMVKPFSIRELLARIKVQFRAASTGGRLLSAGRLELDPTRFEVRLDGAPVSLTATEFRLLETLMRRPGMVFSREQLLDAAWGEGRAVTDRTIDVYILRLRQKIERDPASPEFILSVRGFGYRFRGDAAEPDST
ncbi:MAG: response regulator transcription factor [Acidobacteria bacterium]|nr:response regulator transcription factor [Acidobacteriota bacterium]